MQIDFSKSDDNFLNQTGQIGIFFFPEKKRKTKYAYFHVRPRIRHVVSSASEISETHIFSFSSEFLKLFFFGDLQNI